MQQSLFGEGSIHAAIRWARNLAVHIGFMQLTAVKTSLRRQAEYRPSVRSAVFWTNRAQHVAYLCRGDCNSCGSETFVLLVQPIVQLIDPPQALWRYTINRLNPHDSFPYIDKARASAQGIWDVLCVACFQPVS